MTDLLARASSGRDPDLSVSGAPWETELHPLPDAFRFADSELTVVADATLYRDDAGVRRGAARRIADTYRRHGDDVAKHLDGDFAFILWDHSRRRMLAARDFTGRRPLYVGQGAGTVAVASTVASILEDAGIPRTLDLASLAITAAGLWGHSPATAYSAIHELPPGHQLSWIPGGAPTTSRSWMPPERVPPARGGAQAAAATLRALLEDAVQERLSAVGATAISLSGGWDSPSVLGAGVAVLGAGARDRLRPVSISYPPGDPGREDELIGSILDHTGLATRWIAADAIDLFADAAARARARDLPFAHSFEGWNRALAAGARAEGARVILDGAGGDQLFQVSSVYLADLFRRGRWLALRRQWRQRARRDVRAFWREAVRPALPRWLVAAIARARRTPVPGTAFDRAIPFWFEQRFVATHSVVERERDARPQLPRGSLVLAECHAYLRFPFFGRILSMLQRFAHSEGVELRSPLLDSRVVAFAIGRPWSDRADGRETKVLLRRAMRGLLPDDVLAPRTHRTGVTSAYFLRQLRGPGRPLVDDLLRESRLADLGMIDLSRLRRAWDHVLARDDDEVGIRIFFTLQAELWLRGHAA